MKVLMLCGGRSAEREISLESAVFVRDVLENGSGGHGVVTVEIGVDGSWSLEGSGVSIDAGTGRWRLSCEGRDVPFDMVFPVLHGPYGEDGSVQGLCMSADWPCAGADVLTSALAMNKITCKRLLREDGITVVPWVELDPSGKGAAEQVEATVGFPCFVKPARLGSSVGISRVGSPDMLWDAVRLAAAFDPLVLAEEEVRGAREIEVSVVGDGSGIDASLPGEILPGNEWYDYDAKYRNGDSRLLIPAPLDRETAGLVRDTASRAFSVIGGRGYARVDFLVSADGTVYLNELNTIPGFTSISMFPKLWEATGVPVDMVLERIMSEALTRAPVGLHGGGPA